jgi:Trk K+ transport system NAD-binding subunit
VPGRIRWNQRRKHYIVHGDNPLAHRLVGELLDQLGGEVTVILPSKRRNHGPQIARMENVRIIESAELTKEVLQAARIDTALALALVNQDDVGNIHAAMWAQELNQDLRIVLRMFDVQLGRQLAAMFSDCAILSDSEVAAPWFVADALDELAPTHLHMQGRTLRIAQRSEVGGDRIVCGLATISPEAPPVLLPGDEEDANLVLAVADGTPSDPFSEHRRRRRFSATGLRRLTRLIDRTLLIFLITFLLLLVLATIAFATTGHYSWWNAVYLSVLDAAGAAQPDTKVGTLVQVAEALVTITGIALIPVATAAVLDTVFAGRLAQTLGRLRGPVRDHFVVVGLGNVGSRVVEQLHNLGLPVVCVERSPEARGVRIARRLGIPIVFGDVNERTTLREAYVGSSRAVLALTSDDITNLRAALSARELKPELRIVLRLFDGDFATRVQKSYNITRSRSVSFLSAPSFATAMTESRVINTIGVARSVLLVAEVPIRGGSPLIGQPLADIEQLREVRVLGLGRRGEKWVDWAPRSNSKLAEDDQPVVVATRAGLNRLVERSISDGYGNGGSPVP